MYEINQKLKNSIIHQRGLTKYKKKTETKTRKINKRVPIRHKGSLGDMATQLALQRNFVTITPSNQINSANTQSNHSTTTIATPDGNGEIVTITDGNRVSTSESSNAPIHIMQAHTQVNFKFSV